MNRSNSPKRSRSFSDGSAILKESLQPRSALARHICSSRRPASGPSTLTQMRLVPSSRELAKRIESMQRRYCEPLRLVTRAIGFQPLSDTLRFTESALLVLKAANEKRSVAAHIEHALIRTRDIIHEIDRDRQRLIEWARLMTRSHAFSSWVRLAAALALYLLTIVVAGFDAEAPPGAPVVCNTRLKS